MSKVSIRPQRKGDRLAVLMPGLGAVATTAIAGVEAVKRKLGQPIGSLTQLGYLLQEDGSLGPRVQDAVPMPALDELVFGGWDPIPDNVYQAARRAKVLDHHLVDQLEDVLAPVKPCRPCSTRAGCAGSTARTSSRARRRRWPRRSATTSAASSRRTAAPVA